MGNGKMSAVLVSKGGYGCGRGAGGTEHGPNRTIRSM